MRLDDLRSVLAAFNGQKHGLKKDLISRISTMMRTPRLSTLVCQKVREISRMNSGGRGGSTVANYQQVNQYLPRQYHNTYPIVPQRNGFPSIVPASSMNPIVLNSKIGGRAETMQTTRLPFYDVQKVSRFYDL